MELRFIGRQRSLGIELCANLESRGSLWAALWHARRGQEARACQKEDAGDRTGPRVTRSGGMKVVP